MDRIQDKIFTNIHGKETPYVMWQAPIYLFHNSSGHTKLALKDKLQNIKMQKNETIQQYPSRLTQVRDNIVGVVVTISNDDFISLSLLCLPKN